MEKSFLLQKILIRAFLIISLSSAAGLVFNLVSPGKIPYIYRQHHLVTLSAGQARIIKVAEAYDLFEKKEAVFIDARSADHYRRGHIKGALSLPAYEADSYLDSVVSKVSPEKTVVAYCSGEECDESHKVADILMQIGYRNIIIFSSGFQAWQRAGFPVETGQGRSS